MKKTNLIAVSFAALSVLLLSNTFIASAQDNAGDNKTEQAGTTEKTGFDGMGMLGMNFLNNNNITMNAEKIDGGIRITATSTDPATAAKLQSLADQIAIKTSIKRSVTNISDGIVITTTSDNADAVKLLQQKIPKETTKNNGKFTVTWEAISNGTKQTITSADPALVKKLQDGSANGMMGMGKGYGKYGMMAGKRYGRGH